MNKRLLANAIRYFVMAFALGFALGTVRVLLLVPRIGEASAELLEIPVMLVGIFFIARFLVHRYPQPAGAWVSSGLLALLLLLSFEFTVVLAVRGMSLEQWYASRDPWAFSAYLFALAAFAAMPFFISRRR
ncbi:MAG: hypothetical protein R3270_01125 [Gammaproteobacteria bacterium]|nr:hypothetical protein [Gammaproteobacteria bacterium]